MCVCCVGVPIRERDIPTDNPKVLVPQKAHNPKVLVKEKPMDDHVNSSDCWCEPVRYYSSENGEVWIHRNLADRTDWPSLEVLAEAIVEANVI